jgi:hypothetical protein
MKKRYLIVGMQHRGAEAIAVVADLKPNEGMRIVREPTNPADRNAVQVWAHGLHVGFVKGTQCAELARWMDDRRLPDYGALFVPGAWPRLDVEQF